MRQEILIPPIPKEYISYSEREKVERTEAIYQEIDDMYRRVDIIYDEYRKKIDHLLQSEVSATQLCEVFKEKDAQILCRALNEFYVLKVLCQIAEMEETFQEPCVLRNFHTMEEAVHWLQLCIFSLRNFEFDREYDEELSLQIKEKTLSYICLAEMICDNWIVQKIHTTEKIARYLYENGQKREALLFLMRLEKMLPYSTQKITAFTMTLLDMGECQLAYEVLLKYQNPNEDIRQLQIELSGLL